jgi:hypothetical protein
LVGWVGRTGAARQWLVDHAALAFGTVLLFVSYAVLLRGARPWYHLYALLAFAVIALPILVEALLRAVGRLPLSSSVPAAFVASVVVLGVAVRSVPSQFPQELDKYHAALEVAGLQPGTRLGAFNAGVFGYYLPQGVVDLDGVVNSKVLPAIRHSRLCAYLRDAGIDQIIDDPPTISGLLPLWGPGARIVRVVPLVGGRARVPSVRDTEVLVTLDLSACPSSSVRRS